METEQELPAGWEQVGPSTYIKARENYSEGMVIFAHHTTKVKSSWIRHDTPIQWRLVTGQGNGEKWPTSELGFDTAIAAVVYWELTEGCKLT